jgi:hypothetical protein
MKISSMNTAQIQKAKKEKRGKKNQGGIVYFFKTSLTSTIQPYNWGSKKLDRMTRDMYKMRMQDIGRNDDMNVRRERKQNEKKKDGGTCIAGKVHRYPDSSKKRALGSSTTT